MTSMMTQVEVGRGSKCVAAVSPGDWMIGRCGGHTYSGSVSTRRVSRRDRQKLRPTEKMDREASLALP